MITFARGLAVAALSALVTTGCAGSHSVPSTVPAATTAAVAKTGTANFSLLIPNRSSTASLRSAEYISASTLSGQIIVNGTATTELDLGVGSVLCTTATNGRACAITVGAPAGSDTFTLKLYDGAYTSNVHTGNLLSTAAGFGATIVEGKSNATTPLVLSGVPAFFSLAMSQQPAARSTSGATSMGTAILTVYDRQMNVIVGPGTYATASGVVTGFTIASPTTNYGVGLNGAATTTSIHVTAPSDLIAVSQNNVQLGGELTIVPDSGSVQKLNKSVFIRPIGFAAADIESAQVSSGATGSMLAPISDQNYGVGGLPNYGAVGLFTTDFSAATQTTCGTGFVRQRDLAIAQNTAWTINGGMIFTYDLTTCGANPQYTGMTDVGVGTGIISIDTTCVADFVYYPGVSENPGTGAPANCTGPHDVTANGNTQYAVIETNSSDTHDHVAVYNNLTFQVDIPITNVSATAAGNSLETLASRSDFFFAEEFAAKRLWLINQPGAGPASLNGYLPLPAAYTYQDNTYISPATVEWSNRTMAIGADGYAYIAVSAPFYGVIVVDPVTTQLIRELPNAAAVSGVAAFNVTSDKRGTIYWSAGGYVMHYPSGAHT